MIMDAVNKRAENSIERFNAVFRKIGVKTIHKRQDGTGTMLSSGFFDLTWIRKGVYTSCTSQIA
jgi:hypothetical protein